MKKPVLLFTLKCAAIIYLASTTSISGFSHFKKITPQVTNGYWKVNCYSNTNTDNTCIFNGYTFTFEASGKVVAVKNNVQVTGSWIENDLDKKITISFKNSGTALDELNDYWDIASIQDGHISFERKEGNNTDKLYLSSL